MLAFCLFSLAVAAQAKLLPGSCSFEGNTCGYTSDPSFSSWTQSPDGHFITLDPTLRGVQDKAVLLGQDMDQDWSCLRVVYQITGAGSLQIQRRTEGESFDQVLWTTQSPSDSWLTASIDLENTTESYKIVIEGTSTEGEGSSVSIFEIHISDKYCIECDFEDSQLCGYSNQWNSNVNWYMGGGTLRGQQDNLPLDSTQDDGTGQYMYVDSVNAKTFKEVAKLVSPMTTVPMSGCLSFQYQQDCAEGHLFSLFSRDQAGQYQELWRAGMQGNNEVEWARETKVWIPVQVDLRAPYPLELVFEVAFNSPKGGHVILDDISFSPDFCSANTEPTFDPSVANCDFEAGFCHFTQMKTDGLTWKRFSVRPNIYRVGDHTTGAGSFLLANSRFALHSDHVSHLYGPPLPGKQKYCLRFYYSLRGFSSSEQLLAVYLYDKDDAAQERIWTLSERTRNVWIAADLTIQRPTTTQVVFVSTCKSFWNCGSVALDDISMSLGDCNPQLGSPISALSHCGFEMGLCGHTQDKEGDVGDWMLGRGPTPTSYTGPKCDHTTGVGHYLHIEASAMLPGHNARLLSSPLRGSRGAHCLRFYYHMYGSGTGQLNVFLRSEQQNGDKLLWQRSGEQGISWLKATVSYQYNHQHQIVFEAIRGPSVRSDIAIDDIMFEKGPCSDVHDNIPQQSFSESSNDIE